MYQVPICCIRWSVCFLGVSREIRSAGWLRCLGRDEEEEEAEVEERVVGGFREASSKAETVLEDPIHFLFPVSDRSEFLEGKET